MLHHWPMRRKICVSRARAGVPGSSGEINLFVHSTITIHPQVIHEARDAKLWLRDAKFSPKGETFALASQVTVFT